MADPHMIAALERFPTNPLIVPSDISFVSASGTFNPGVALDPARGIIVMLVRVYDSATRRSFLSLATSPDGRHIDKVWDSPAVAPDAPYEEWGVEDARITWLPDEGRYAITYTGYSPAGIRVCLITTDDLLAPDRYRRHGPRMQGDNKNCVILPEKIDGEYVILHRPLPRIVCARTRELESAWPEDGVTLVGPQPDTWRSARVGAGAAPIRTELGWLLPIHGATTIPEGNIYSMGWCVLDADSPEKVRYVSDAPVLTPQEPYEIEMQPIPQVDMASFPTGVRVVFPEGLVELGDDLLVYYGAADVSIAGASVNRAALVESLATAIGQGEGGLPV
ncbi:glycosidase [soil metagenome]